MSRAEGERLRSLAVAVLLLASSSALAQEKFTEAEFNKFLSLRKAQAKRDAKPDAKPAATADAKSKGEAKSASPKGESRKKK